ncbi:MAG TPA: substrate-binding domain-containing protein, partial [Chitinophagaceae bacterium]
QRLKGYKDALLHHNIPIDDELVIYGKVTIDSGRECMNRLLALTNGPDGLFAVEDFTALGAMQAIKSAGRSIPGDIAIIGFANEAFGEYISPSLSTVDQQTIKMGEEAAKLFFELSIRERFYDKEVPKRILEPVLVYRNSSIRKGA